LKRSTPENRRIEANGWWDLVKEKTGWCQVAVDSALAAVLDGNEDVDQRSIESGDGRFSMHIDAVEWTAGASSHVSNDERIPCLPNDVFSAWKSISEVE